MGLLNSIQVVGAIAALEVRGVFNQEEADALTYFSLHGNNPEFLRNIAEGNRVQNETKRAICRLLYQPGFIKEIERKLADHIIPFIRKTGLCYYLK